MPRVIGSRRRARSTAGTFPVRRAPDPADLPQRRRPLPTRDLELPSPATVLAIVGIALGASLIFGSSAMSRGVERSIERTVATTLGRADFRISGPDGGTLSEDVLVTIRSVLGVVVGPMVEQRATLFPEDETVAPTELPVTILGIDPLVDGEIHDLDLLAGEAITRREEAAAVITERLAAAEGYGLGSDVIVATPGEPERFRVIGIAAGDGPLTESDGRTVILPIEAVTRMFGLTGVARVDLLVEEGVPVEGVRVELGEVLGGEEYVLTSPAELAESLQLPTRGVAVASLGLGAAGVLAGAMVVFGAVRLTAGGTSNLGARSLARDAAVHGAIGSGVAAVLLWILAVLTRSDVAPAALGLGGMAIAILVTVLSAVAGAVLPPGRVPLTPARRGLLVLAVVIGLSVAIATVGANAQRAAADQASAPVLDRVAAGIDTLWLLALVVAAVAIVAGVATAGRLPLVPRAAVILGLTGAVVGSIAGLVVGSALILLGDGGFDAAADVPWVALGLALVLGGGLSWAAAWLGKAGAGRSLC